jgi:hypothetical protein
VVCIARLITRKLIIRRRITPAVVVTVVSIIKMNFTRRECGSKEISSRGKEMGESPMKSNRKNPAGGISQLLAAVALLFIAAVSLNASSARSKDATQASFASPEEAGKALQAASQNEDEAALAKILGPDSKAILSSGDSNEDKAALKDFVAKYDLMHRWVAMTDGSQILNVGADNYPFPIPLVKDSSSSWYFDTKAGADEVLARRIGRNEIVAIDACSAIANSEEVYSQQPHDGNPKGVYTTKLFSTSGKQDGLYWEVPRDQESSPLGRVEDFAKDALLTPNESPVIDGYSFRILTAQGSKAAGGAKQYIIDGKMTGGFAVIATPVKYRDSGVMTFIISQQGIVFQQDLGADSAKVAAEIQEYNPTSQWKPVI